MDCNASSSNHQVLPKFKKEQCVFSQQKDLDLFEKSCKGLAIHVEKPIVLPKMYDYAFGPIFSGKQIYYE